MIIRERYERIPVAGKVAWNTYSDIRGESTQIVVNPSVTNTTYDLLITDDSDTVIYQKTNLKGVFVDDIKMGLYGFHTFNLTNTSSSLYSFTVTLLWNERVAA